MNSRGWEINPPDAVAVRVVSRRRRPRLSDGEQTGVGGGDAVRIARQVLHRWVRVPGRRLRVYDHRREQLRAVAL
jgi:hypothetical protein